MADGIKESSSDIADTTSAIVGGLENEKASPKLMVIIVIFAIIAILYLFIPYLIQTSKNNAEVNKYAIDSFNNQLKITTDNIIKFDNSIANVNSNIDVLRLEQNDTRNEQSNIKHTINS